MCLGNIYSGLNFKKVINLANICMLTEDDCQNCWAIRHCTICPVQADNYGKLSKKTILSKCPFVRKGIEKSLERIIAVKELQSDFIWEDAE